MTKKTKVSAWTPPEDILMIFSVMEQMEQKVREGNKEEKMPNSNKYLTKRETDKRPKHFQMKFKNGILSPINKHKICA